MSDRDEDARSASDEDEGRPRAGERAAQDDLSELVGADAVDEDERTEDDRFELDQTELDELGLTLDDPHQPGRE
jgi:hypothetical protein